MVVHKKNAQPYVIIPALLVIFGGPAGVAAVILDYLKKGSYKPGQKPDTKKTVTQLFIAGLLFVFFGGTLGNFAADLVIPGASWAQEFLPGATQAVLGLVVTSRYLHKSNIYFTSKDFWKGQNFNLKDLERTDLKDILKPNTKTQNVAINPMATSSSNAAAPTSPYSSSQNQSAIIVDQSGDTWRVKLIVFAVVALLGLLSYQYLASNPEAVIEKANQVMQQYVEVEKL